MEKCFKNIRKEKEKAHSDGTSSIKNSDRPAQKCFRCGSEDHMIAKCPNPPKDSEKRCKSENLSKMLIVYATIAMMTMTIRYTHLWHECLVMINAKVNTMVRVRN